MERYEITLDVDDDVVMSDEPGHGHHGSTSTQYKQQQPITTLQQLQSAVIKRRGRGFSDGRSHDSVLASDHHSHHSHNHQEQTLPSGEALPERSVEGWTVFLSGLHEETTEDAIIDFITDMLPNTNTTNTNSVNVREVKVAMDHRSGYAKGYGIVECREYREARAVIEAIDGRPFLGQPVRADFAFVRPNATMT